MYKLKHALQKGKIVFIAVLILWIMLSIVLIAPITVTLVEIEKGETATQSFFDEVIPRFGKIGENVSKVFNKDYIKRYAKGELYLAAVLLFCAAVGIIKSLPKNEYTDIEHGSSDWATGGEQYKVLSSKKGIILAEKNYLPVDKRGNVNVLVVGRFWFW